MEDLKNTYKQNPKNPMNFWLIGLIVLGIVIVGVIRIPSFKDSISSNFKFEKQADYSDLREIKEGVELDFRESLNQEEEDAAVAALENNEIKEDFDFYDLTFRKTDLNQDHIKGAKINYDAYTGDPIVLLKFTEEGQELFREITKENIGNQIGIFVDGVLVSSPTVQEQIDSDEASITGIDEDDVDDFMETLVGK